MTRMGLKSWAILTTATTVLLLVLCAILFVSVVLAAFGLRNKGEIKRHEYVENMNLYADLISSYAAYHERTGAWPVPGTYDQPALKYLGTGRDLEGDRLDRYLVDFDTGIEIEFEFRYEGTVRVWQISE